MALKCAAQLEQLVTLTHDGNLISKTDRDFLAKQGLCDKVMGYNVLTIKGINTLVALGSDSLVDDGVPF